MPILLAAIHADAARLTTRYIVATRDVDGRTRRVYRSLKGAVSQFELMLGHSVQSAIEEQFYARMDQGLPLPKLEDLRCLRGVSDYGTVVSLEIIKTI